jgi:pre-mRNA-processing factor 40
MEGVSKWGAEILCAFGHKGEQLDIAERAQRWVKAESIDEISADLMWKIADLFDSIPDEASPAPGSPAPAMSPGGVAPRPIYSGPPPGFASPNGAGQPGFPPSGMGAPPARAPAQPSVSIAGGEEAFLQLLKEKNVTPAWTWEQTMREIITEPLYKSLATLAERKAAFSKYIQSIQEQEDNSRKERAKAIEPRIRKVMQPLIDNGQMKAWLSYEGMLCRCNEHAAWKALEQVGIGEARELWAVIRREIREKDAAQAREIRHRNMDMLMSVLKAFEADVMTRWKDARQTIMESDEWKEDKHLSTMDMSDMLTVFDEHMKTIEKEKGEDLKQKAHDRKRQDRKRRDWFRETLQNGKQEGWLHAKTDFSEVYERFKDNNNFIAMLGQPGSSALDLFFDVLDPLEQELKATVHSVEQILAKADGLRVDESTSLADLQAALENSPNGALATNEGQLKLVLEDLQRVSKEENRRGERKLRHLSEDLRYALKKVAHHRPELFESEEELSKPWEQVKEKLQELRLAEWVAFDEVTMPIRKDKLEEARKGAWERFVQRQRERMAEKKQREIEARSQEQTSSPRRKRGEDAGEDDRRRSSRRAGKIDEETPSRTRSSATRKERRAGEMDDTREKDRKERRRSAAGEDFEAVKRPRIEVETVEAEENADSEKEEGEV